MKTPMGLRSVASERSSTDSTVLRCALTAQLGKLREALRQCRRAWRAGIQSGPPSGHDQSLITLPKTRLVMALRLIRTFSEGLHVLEGVLNRVAKVR